MKTKNGTELDKKKDIGNEAMNQMTAAQPWNFCIKHGSSNLARIKLGVFMVASFVVVVTNYLTNNPPSANLLAMKHYTKYPTAKWNTYVTNYTVSYANDQAVKFLDSPKPFMTILAPFAEQTIMVPFTEQKKK